jgi:hypothetical protein
MAVKTILLLLFVVFVSEAQRAEFIDFTHTQLLLEANYTGDYSDRIVILPDNKEFQQYQFPDVCKLKERL